MYRKAFAKQKRLHSGSSSGSSSEEGGIPVEKLFSLALIILITWTLVVFFPYFHVPPTIEDAVEEDILDFLRLPVPEKAKATKRRELEQNILATVEEILADHKYVEREVKKGINIRSNKNVAVAFDYTIIIDYFGMEFTFDKRLDVRRKSANF